MNPELLAAWRAVKARWTALSKALRTFAIAAVACVALGFGVVAYLDANPRMDVLFANLGQGDAARIVERLKAMQVPFELGASGAEVLVPAARLHELRLALAADGLPSGEGVGFEIFDAQRFGESEFAEQVKYHRALEGELARTIKHIEGVEGVRVHLVMPARSVFANDSAEASASVSLDMRAGWKPRPEEVRGIARLVASSVRGLTPDRVTIVDETGKRLDPGDEEGNGSASTAFAVKQSIERSQERALQELLDRMLGPGQSVVRVATEMTFAREEQTEERVDPEGVAARSYQLTEERTAGSGAPTAPTPAAAGGPVGATSNLQPNAALTGVATATNTEGLVRRSETRNFEVTKTITRAVQPIGRVSRLQVAVVVDGHWRGKGAARRFEARPAAEMERIRGVLESAAGIVAERGDKVTVECLPLVNEAEVATATPQAFPIPLPPGVTPVYAMGTTAGVVALLVLAAAILLRRRKAKALAALALAAPGVDGAPPTRINVTVSGEGKKTDSVRPPPSLERPPELPKDPEQLRGLVGELVAQDTARAADIVRGWLREDNAA